ncbi:MAG: hypothetical protein E7081_08655 [Bacteroidales bacterium]|nr:hypothetical protein [Bacteroidales bacterium]
MKRIVFIVNYIAVVMCANIAIAQYHPTMVTQDRKIEFVVGNDSAMQDSVANPYDVLLENRPVDPDFVAPHFAIIDKEQRFYLSLGATVKALISEDYANPYDNPTDFKPSAFTKALPGNEQSLQMTIKSSSINLNIVGMPKNKYRIGLFAMLMFNGGVGNDYFVKCDHAYIRCMGLTMGYTSSVYDDKSADAYLIDGNGPGASGGHSNMTFNWQRNLSREIRVGAGIELPKVSYTQWAASDEQMVNQRVPSIPFYVQYAWGEIGHVRLSSVVRTMTYRDYVDNRNRSLVGYGLKFTSNYKIGNVVGYFMAQGGSGIANYLKDNDGFCLDLVPDANNSGQLKRTEAWGGLAALQYYYKPNMFSTAMYGYMRNYVDKYENGSIDFGQHMKYEHYAAVNFIWRASSFVDIGVEYNYGLKRSFANESIHNNRITAMFKVGF